jgi:hypothetical protein
MIRALTTDFDCPEVTKEQIQTRLTLIPSKTTNEEIIKWLDFLLKFSENNYSDKLKYVNNICPPIFPFVDRMIEFPPGLLVRVTVCIEDLNKTDLLSQILVIVYSSA